MGPERNKEESLLTLRQQLTAARGHHGAVFGGLTMRTRRQLDVIAAVAVTQAGRSGEPQERIHMHRHVQTNITES